MNLSSSQRGHRPVPASGGIARRAAIAAVIAIVGGAVYLSNASWRLCVRRSVADCAVQYTRGMLARPEERS